MDDARRLVKALKGKWYNTYGVCCCPAHDDQTPSLSITERDGRVLFCCHAGCSQVAVLRVLVGRRLLPAHDERNCFHSFPAEPKHSGTEAAARIWAAADAPVRTLVECYLKNRAVHLPPASSDAIRFHPALMHPSGKLWPAMVAAITDAATGMFLGVHRTFLDPATGDKARLHPNKMILGKKRGGVIRLVGDDEIGRRLGYAEGIETALSAVSAQWACWSAIDAGNLASLPVWSWIDLTIFVDNDAAGIAAAQTLGTRWKSAGGSATLIRAPRAGEDWNDVAQRIRGAA